MKRVVLIVCSLLLLAATPDDVVADLEDQGYYIEPGSAASEEVVSDAVFQGRADGGRLYIVVLAEEPPGGAPTFSDSVLDLLGTGYVVTVAPETVGYAGDGTFWDAGDMDQAVQVSLEGSSDDEVVQLFVSELTGGVAPGPGGDDGESDAGGSGSGWIWLVILGGGALLVWAMMRNGSKKRSVAAAAEMEKVRAMARAKLADIANDILEMEDEVQLSENLEAKAHYQRASSTYTETLARMEQEPGPGEMVDVVRDLDLAIWELDAAEALLDGKPVPEKPKPPEPAPPVRRPPEPAGPEETDDIGRRPQRQSTYAGNDMMTALWAILAMSGRGGGWGGGGWGGGFGGPMRGGGGGRMRGGGMRMGGFGGRMRGGGRR